MGLQVGTARSRGRGAFFMCPMHGSSTRRAASALLVALLLALAAGTFLTRTRPVKLGLGWFVTSDPLPYNNEAYGVCIRDGDLYVVGGEGYGEGPRWRFRVERRSVSDGSLVDAWSWLPGGVESGMLSDCVLVGSTLYSAGAVWYGVNFTRSRPAWVIVKFGGDLRPLRCEFTLGGIASAIAADARYLYVTGRFFSRWRVEKRELGSLRLVGSYESVDGLPFDIGVNPTTGDLWVVGYAEEWGRSVGG